MSKRQLILRLNQWLLFAAVSYRVCGQQDTTTDHLMLGNIYRLLDEDSIFSEQTQQSSVAGFRKEDIRETTGSIQIITAEQISALGASDLMEVLMSISGISLGRDVDDAIGVGMRGLWAHEGKVLFMLNGIPLNDLEFGTYALGGRTSLENVSRIEIMNGPGSVVYGGSAALGVINIITKTPLEMSGTRISMKSGVSKGYSTNNEVNISSNHILGQDTYLSLQAGMKSTLRSTINKGLSDGSSISFGDSTRIQSQNIYIGVTKKNLQTQFYLNNYTYDVSDQAYSVMMFSSAWDNQWQKQIGEKTLVKLRSTYQYQLPWFNLNSSDPSIISTNTISQKVTGSALIEHNFNNHFTWTTGLQSYHQNGRVMQNNLYYYYNMKNQMNANDVAIHSELNYSGKVGIIKLGGRVEKNTYSSILFSPRLAYNKIFGKHYIKALMSNAFKIPTLQNINLGPSDEILKHESVASAELTLGSNFKDMGSAELVLFTTGITNPITYALDSIQLDNYTNRKYTGTSGLEGRFHYFSKKVNLYAGYCLYAANSKSDLPEVELTNYNVHTYLGFARSRATSSMDYKISKAFSMYWSAIFQGSIRSYEYEQNNSGTLQLKEFSPTLIFNAGIQISPQNLKSLNVQLNANNVFNAAYNIASPINNGLTALPVYAQRFTLSLTYRLNS